MSARATVTRHVVAALFGCGLSGTMQEQQDKATTMHESHASSHVPDTGNNVFRFLYSIRRPCEMSASKTY